MVLHWWTRPTHGCLLLVWHHQETGFRVLPFSLWVSEVIFCPMGDMGPIARELSLIYGGFEDEFAKALGRWPGSGAHLGDAS